MPNSHYGPPNSEVDRLALIYFRDGVDEELLRVLSSWNDSSRHYKWQGVVCSGQHPERVSVPRPDVKRLGRSSIASCQKPLFHEKARSTEQQLLWRNSTKY
ncbi:hypothetical protein NL676_028064 [Syzygium grande]|nr:hypothetical protein NL676_028064 [Syzygium grande]